MSAKKAQKGYKCTNCEHRLPKWMGQCPQCLQWNTLKEITSESKPKKASDLRVKKLREADEMERIPTGYSELDGVLGGGIVPGGVVLLSGEPGIGKSTLLLQLAAEIPFTALYLSGEESTGQIRMRAERIGALSGILLAGCTETDHLKELVAEHEPGLVIIDSIQTMFDPELSAQMGSIKQIAHCTQVLIELAKSRNVAIFIIGHITKGGNIAGPKTMEHMVDTVLYLEGQRHYDHRILRAKKNRFGPTDEIGVFRMGEGGLKEVPNPSHLFLAERPRNVSGSVVIPSLEGNRPLLVELQALVSPSSYGNPYRLTNGVESKRLALILAVLEKRLGYQLLNDDIYINVAGGIHLDEPAVDLGLALAVASSFSEKPVDYETVVCGEIGLAGEIRAITNLRKRLIEADRLGFRCAVVPAGRLEVDLDLEIIGVGKLKEAIDSVLGGC